MVKVLNKIIVPGNPAQDNGYTKAPWTGVHLHSTGNPTSQMSGERAWLGRNYMNANYTHLVGWNPETGRAEAWQVMKKGGAWDVGGSANYDGWASIEFVEGSVSTQAQFNAAYKVYIELARQLVKEIDGDYKVDDGSYTGIETHNYISKTGRGSDHVDPLPFLQKWGVSYAQLKRDMVGLVSKPDPVKPAQTAGGFKAGDVIKVSKNATHWQTGKSIAGFVKGQTYKVKQVKAVNQSKSKQALLLEGVNSWLLAQDAETTTKTYKEGNTIKVAKYATKWQTGQKIPEFVNGKSYKVKQVKAVKQSKSKQALLLDGVNSWLLSQDVQ